MLDRELHVTELSEGVGMPGSPAGTVATTLAAIRARGGRVSRPRVLIVEVLVNAPSHINADELLALVKARDPGVHEATIYRTLAALEELGILYHVHLGHGPAVWHLAQEEHHHLVCLRCDGVTHADGRDFTALAQRVSSQYGFRLRPHFADTGICARCAEAPVASRSSA